MGTVLRDTDSLYVWQLEVNDWVQDKHLSAKLLVANHKRHMFLVKERRVLTGYVAATTLLQVQYHPGAVHMNESTSTE